MHLRTDVEGLPVAVLLTPGEARESTVHSDPMAAHDVNPDVLLADRRYARDAIRDGVRNPGGTPEIPFKKNRRVRHFATRALNAQRNRVERIINRMKNSRRAAT